MITMLPGSIQPESPETPEGVATSGLAPGRRRRLLLASQSPRRRSLLAEAGVAHEATHPGVDDGVLASGVVSPSSWVAALAYLKASAGVAGLGDAGEATVVLGADTVCVVEGRLVGQPRDAAAAEATLRSLIAASAGGGWHEVLTGVALVCAETGRRELFVDRAEVRFGDPGEDELRAYVASGEWAGKAGAYNLGERLEAGWPIEYEGDPTTIMGLPMGRLRAKLAAFGV
ncbi:MAG: Maf-like protein [Phycisphaerales bacterium]|nr:MAG: Maf-like protein [Phycisphaerales bacterium]